MRRALSQHVVRRAAAPLSMRAAPVVAGTACQQRTLITDCPCLANIGSHMSQIPFDPAGTFALSTLMYSPVGTLVLVVAAYNVMVIGSNHFFYTADLTAKDYLQDQELYHVMRYVIKIMLILSLSQLFIEP